MSNNHYNISFENKEYNKLNKINKLIHLSK